MPEQTPSVGRIVHFYPGAFHRDQFHKDLGAQVAEGQPIPAVIVRVWGTAVNLKVLNDGPEDAWVTSVEFDNGQPTENSRWCWPPRT